MQEKIKKDEKSNLLSVRKLKELLHSRHRKLRQVEAKPSRHCLVCLLFTGNCKPLCLARLFPSENPSSREKSQTLPVLTETGRNHEKNVDFNHWDADQARQLFELVRDIETYQFSKQSRAVEEGLRKDLNELKKIAKGEGGIKDPLPFAKACCAWYERQKQTNIKVSLPDPS